MIPRLQQILSLLRAEADVPPGSRAAILDKIAQHARWTGDAELEQAARQEMAAMRAADVAARAGRWRDTSTDELNRCLLQYREDAYNEGGRGDYEGTQREVEAILKEFERRGEEPV
jgi:hypothetical protein